MKNEQRSKRLIPHSMDSSEVSKEKSMGSFNDDLQPNLGKSSGGSPGLVVMGGESCSKGCEFKSRHHLLDGHFFTFICYKNCYVFEKTKINEKRLGWPIFFKKT